MVATALAALHGAEVGRVVVLSGSAGSPNSILPTADAVGIVTDPNTTTLEGASISYPVDTPAGRALPSDAGVPCLPTCSCLPEAQVCGGAGSVAWGWGYWCRVSGGGLGLKRQPGFVEPCCHALES